MKILYIHGANCTSTSWNYIRSQIDHSHDVVDYSCLASFHINLKKMEKMTMADDWLLVGHSLGGIYALHLSKFLGARCIGGVSISTPFSGTRLADIGRMMIPWYQLFRDVGTASPAVIESQRIGDSLKTPWTQIVTTAGNVPYIIGKNDGVCTEMNMLRHKNNMKIIKTPSTHYEVLQDNKVILAIRDFLPQNVIMP